MNNFLSTFIKGMAMGAANVIPGVSGGTIALITGIFERLIFAIKSFDLQALKLLMAGQVKSLWEKVDGNFLVALFGGIAVSILSLARLFKFLMEDQVYSIWLMAFFFGLILVSIWSVGKTVSQWKAPAVVALVIGAGIALAIALLRPAEENSELWYLLICGVVAMCSMILPGLSGSFVLILMGNYKLVMLDAVSEFNLGILIPVAMGAVLGLVAFSQLLSWIFKHYRDVTIALLTGFIAGSLSLIWPWKNEVFLQNELGEQILKKGKPVVEGYEWYLPDLLSAQTLVALFFIVVGGFLVARLENLAPKEEKSSNVA